MGSSQPAAHTIAIVGAKLICHQPSGEKATAPTPFICPLSVWHSCPDRASHSLTVPSHDAEATTAPSGKKAMALTFRMPLERLVLLFRLRDEADGAVRREGYSASGAPATTEPSGEKATAPTPFVCYYPWNLNRRFEN